MAELAELAELAVLAELRAKRTVVEQLLGKNESGRGVYFASLPADSIYRMYQNYSIQELKDKKKQLSDEIIINAAK